MTVFVEAIGGTGKAIVNLLKFTEEIAGIIGERLPEYTCAVIDQDANPQSVWEGVPIQKAVSGRSGPFQVAIELTRPAQHCAARLLFSAAELTTDVSEGFHGQAKLVVSLPPEGATPSDASQVPTHVLVYSDFGGTGAGLGPLRLQQLLANPAKTDVIAIVFGKYLNKGAQTPTGYQWLERQRLPDAQAQRLFFGFYVHVPWLHVDDDTAPPASGLNATPALLLAAAYIWRLAEASRAGRLRQFLHTNAVRTDRRTVREVRTYHDGDFRIEGAEAGPDFMTRLRQCAQANRLNGLIPTKKMFLNVELREALQRGLAPECWHVFQARQPAGEAPALSVNWAQCFNDTFSSVPDPWAAAEWFHRAVAAGDPTCRAAFLRLIGLFVQGKLHVFRTGWGPRGGPEVYALSTQSLSRAEGQLTEQFEEVLVGGFSRDFPFWTVPAFIDNLRAEEVRGGPSEVTLRLREQSTCGSVYQTQSQPIQVPDAPYVVHIQPVQHLEPSRWSWAIYLRAGDWNTLDAYVSGWELLKNNVEVYQGGVTISPATAGMPAYTCAMRGIHLKKRLLDEDGIFVGQRQGSQYYEVEVAPEPQKKRVLNNAEHEPQPQFVQDNDPLVVLYGNILIAM